MKLGTGLTREHKGLIASGVTTSEPWTAPHWDESQADAGAETSYVKVRFDQLNSEPIVSLDELEYRFGGITWTPQRSGNEIPDRILSRLEAEWRRRIRDTDLIVYPDEPRPGEIYFEGAVRRVVVNRFERDPAARDACVAHYGDSCSVCDLSLAEIYGDLAAGFIHVHHLKPLADIRGAHQIDPIVDLRPVCPNCHAVLHMRKPAMSIDELRAILAATAN